MVPDYIILIDTDLAKLREAIREARGSWRTYAPSLHALEHQMRHARVVPSADAPTDLVTMNSRFCLRDLKTDEAQRFKLVYSTDDDDEERRLSVFNLTGMAVLGRRVGDVIRWIDEAGPHTARVERVFLPSEAARDREARNVPQSEEAMPCGS